MPLDIQLRVAPPLDLAADVLVVGVLQMGGKTPSLPPSLKAIDDALGGALAKLVAKDEFTGKRDQSLSVSTLGRIQADKVVLLGLGEKRSLHAAEVRTFAAKAARIGNGEKAKSLALALPAGLEGDLRIVAEGL
jgi:leucyl aminopeptidase